MTRTPFKKTSRGVAFITEELEYLDELTGRMGTDRSTVINALIREHRQRNGDPAELLALIYNMAKTPEMGIRQNAAKIHSKKGSLCGTITWQEHLSTREFPSRRS